MFIVHEYENCFMLCFHGPFTLATFTAISSAILSLWRMWTSMPVAIHSRMFSWGMARKRALNTTYKWTKQYVIQHILYEYRKKSFHVILLPQSFWWDIIYICTDDYLGLRIESFAIIKLRGVNYNFINIVFTMQTGSCIRGANCTA
jgi:hypothetical protein